MTTLRALFLLATSCLAACGSNSKDGNAPANDAGTNTDAAINAGGAPGGTSGTAGANGGGATGGSAGTPSDGGGSGDSSAAVDAGPSNDAGSGGINDAGLVGSNLWVLGYWAVWQATDYPLDRVQWDAMTHAAISFVLPRSPVTPTTDSPYATLDTSNAVGNLGPTGMADFAAAAHAGGVKPLISLGGAGTGVGFAGATSDANRAQLISEVLAACAQWNYDGVDLDWEDNIDFANFQALVHELRSAAPPGFLITVPVGSVNTNLGIDADTSNLWSSSYADVDQINVMTYTGSGAYPGWVVWYLSPLFGQGPDHPFDVDTTMEQWSSLGIPKSKLGLGLGFYGRAVGPPVTAALQSYDTAVVYENDTTLSYGSILRNFYGKGGAVYHWDDTAKAPYLSWPAAFQPAWANDFPYDTPPTVQFLTYEDAAGIAAKGDWAKTNGYGGAIIWTINEGVEFPDGSDGYANPLLEATKAAFR